MHELLVANGESSEAFGPISVFADVLRNVMASKAGDLADRGYVLPGVADALFALANQPNVLQSVLTGNVMENSRLEVTTFGLEKWLDLDIGGSGSDDIVRSKLIDASRRRVDHCATQGQGAEGGAHRGGVRLAACSVALRPPARLRLDLARGWGAVHPMRRVGRPQRGGAAPSTRRWSAAWRRRPTSGSKPPWPGRAKLGKK
jgi:hypothetical protein